MAEESDDDEDGTPPRADANEPEQLRAVHRIASGIRRWTALTLDSVAQRARVSPECPHLLYTSVSLNSRFSSYPAWHLRPPRTSVLAPVVFYPCHRAPCIDAVALVG